MAARPVLLVHGAWSGAWCWAPVQCALDRLGVASHTLDLPGRGASPLPLGDLAGDAESVAAAARALGPDVVLVGHSYGGAVITGAAALAEVSHLVYIAAFALDDGESVNGFLRAAPRHRVELADAIRPADEVSTVLDPEIAGTLFYPAVSDLERSAMVERQSAQLNAAMVQPVSGSPRATTPSTFILCRNDRTVHPEHQRILAGRCDEVIELDRDHFPFLEDADETARVIAQTARR